MNKVQYVLVAQDVGVVRRLTNVLENLGSESNDVSEVKGLGGSVTEWIVAGLIAARLVPPLLKALLPFVEMGQVQSIKAGDIEIVRPSSEDVARILENHYAKETSRAPDQDGE